MACLLAQAHNLSLVEIESDNQVIIKLYVSETIPPWEIMAFLFLIIACMLCRSWRFMWTRSNNRVAHWVDKGNSNSLLSASWVSYPPLALGSLLSALVFSHPS